MSNNFSNKKKAFISYWTNTIVLKLYNMFYVLKYLDDAKKAKEGQVKKFKDINNNIEICDMMKEVKENSKYKEYHFLRKYMLSKNKKLKNQKNKDNLFKDLIDLRDYFSHSEEWIKKENKKIKYNEPKFLLLIFMYLEPKQLHEFLSMAKKYDVDIDKYQDDIKKLISDLDNNPKYNKLINEVYGFNLSEKIYNYFTLINDNKNPSEIQTYDLLLTFLEELFYNNDEDKEIIEELREKNTRYNLRKYKGNLGLNNKLVLSKNVIIK